MIQPRNRLTRCFTSNLVASCALALTAALISISVAAEASAQGFTFPRVGMTSGGGKVWNKSYRPPQRRPGGVTIAGAGAGGAGKSNGARAPREDGGPVVIRKRKPNRPPSVGVGTAVGLGSGTPSSGGPSSATQALRRPGSGVPRASERNYVPDEVVTELAASTTDQAAAALARRFRLTQLESFDFKLAGTKLYRWRIPDRRPVPAVVRAIEADRTVISVSPNYIMYLNGEASAAAGSLPLEQYALAKLHLPQAHALARGSDVVIAIIDGGVDTSHPELAGVVMETFDAIGTGDKTHPHGTAVAGAIAAQARLRGTAPAARILAARAFDRGKDKSEGTAFDVVKALDWAVAHGARIINMSFAGGRDPHIELSLRAARAKGVILVAAAGNKGPRSAPLFPAADPNVIAVTATDADDKLFSAANRGSHIAVAAPGVELWLPGLHGTYQEVSGTSFASAHVAGTIALMVERKPDIGQDDVRRILMSTARDLGPGGVDPQFGAGLVDAYRALLSTTPTVAGSSTAPARQQN